MGKVFFTLTSHSVTKNIDITSAYQTASISTDPTSSIAKDNITDLTNSRKHDGAALLWLIAPGRSRLLNAQRKS